MGINVLKVKRYKLCYIIFFNQFIILKWDSIMCFWWKFYRESVVRGKSHVGCSLFARGKRWWTRSTLTRYASVHRSRLVLLITQMLEWYKARIIRRKASGHTVATVCRLWTNYHLKENDVEENRRRPRKSFSLTF